MCIKIPMIFFYFIKKNNIHCESVLCRISNDRICCKVLICYFIKNIRTYPYFLKKCGFKTECTLELNQYRNRLYVSFRNRNSFAITDNDNSPILVKNGNLMVFYISHISLVDEKYNLP